MNDLIIFGNSIFAEIEFFILKNLAIIKSVILHVKKAITNKINFMVYNKLR